MNRKQIARFVKKINYGEKIEIEYIKSRDKTNFLCAQAGINRFVKDGQLYIVSLLQINKDSPKTLHESELKAILLHEVGHLHTGYRRKGNKITNKSVSVCEYEAQVWALERCRELKMNILKRGVVQILLNWRDFDWNSDNQVYRRALKMAVRNKKFKKEIEKCFKWWGVL